MTACIASPTDPGNQRYRSCSIKIVKASYVWFCLCAVTAPHQPLSTAAKPAATATRPTRQTLHALDFTTIVRAVADCCAQAPPSTIHTFCHGASVQKAQNRRHPRDLIRPYGPRRISDRISQAQARAPKACRGGERQEGTRRKAALPRRGMLTHVECSI